MLITLASSDKDVMGKLEFFLTRLRLPTSVCLIPLCAERMHSMSTTSNELSESPARSRAGQTTPFLWPYMTSAKQVIGQHLESSSGIPLPWLTTQFRLAEIRSPHESAAQDAPGPRVAESLSAQQEAGFSFLEPLGVSWLLLGLSPPPQSPEHSSSGPPAAGGARIHADLVAVECSRGTL